MKALFFLALCACVLTGCGAGSDTSSDTKIVPLPAGSKSSGIAGVPNGANLPPAATNAAKGGK